MSSSIPSVKCLVWPWETSVWHERIEHSLRFKVSDYGDVDKIIEHILGKEKTEQVYTRDAFANAMYNYHIRDKSPDEFVDFETKTKSTRFPKDFLKGKIIPFIQKLAVNLPHMFSHQRVKLMLRGQNSRVVLSREQVSALLAGAFFGIFDSYDELPPFTEGRYFGKFSFLHLYKICNMYAIESIIYYFGRIMAQEPTGELIIRRHRIPFERCPVWKDVEIKLGSVKLLPDHRIWESKAELQIGESSSAISGDALVNGKGREEILFLTHPELLVLRLICESVDDDEAIAVMGAERFSEYEGFGTSLKFIGGYQDTYHRTQDGTISRSICFADCTTNIGNYTEYTTEFDRDLNKIFIALNLMKPPAVKLDFGTTHWGDSDHKDITGCNKYMKFIQQYMAASALGLTLCYYPGNNSGGNKPSNGNGNEFLNYAVKFINHIKRQGWTISDLYKRYKKIAADIKRDVINGYNDIKIEDLNLFKMMMEN